jgi:inner membrane protein COX18
MFDESLVNGGLLWFTDLSSADPYYGLPVICSGILASSIWSKMPIKELLNILPKDGTDRQFTNRLQILLGRTLLLMPALPILFADLPCAIFLYWSTSFALTWANEFFLTRLVTPKTASLTAPRMNKELPFLPPRQSQNGGKS